MATDLISRGVAASEGSPPDLTGTSADPGDLAGERDVGRERLIAALTTIACAGLLVVVALTTTGIAQGVRLAVFEAAFAAAAAACLLRGLAAGPLRATWLLAGGALCGWLAGDLHWSLWLAHDPTPPAYTVGDICYLAFYPLMAGALIVGMRSAQRRLRAAISLDVLAGAMITAALAVAVLYPALSELSDGAPDQVAVNLAYPVGDLVLAVLLLVRIALVGMTHRRSWTPMLAGLICFLAADAAFLGLIAEGSYLSGGLLDSLWLAGAVLIALGAARHARGGQAVPAQPGWVLSLAPVLFVLAATGLMTVDHFWRTNVVSLILTAAALVTLSVRLWLTFGDNARLLAAREHDALHDPLTGLPNRRELAGALGRELALSLRRGTRVSMLMIDIDNFKYVNDTFGHAQGDKLIDAVGRAIRRQMRAGDLLARLGGDEFAALLVDADRAAAEHCARRIVHAMRNADLIAGAPRGQVTVSVGGAVLDSSRAHTWEDALNRADAAMYAAKDAGRNGWVILDEAGSSEAMAAEHFTWGARIRRALDGDGFTLFAQPVFDTHTRAVHAHELLLRLRNPDGGLWLPGAFLGEAERFGLMTAIDRWVIERAVCLAADSPTALMVNLSPDSMADPDARAFITGCVRDADLPAGRLAFEITEHAAVADLPAARAFAAELRQLGCGLALDDFGVAFASFYHLKELPFDSIKIDGSFIRSITEDATDQALVRAIVTMARELGKSTVAEHVDGEEAMALLAVMGVDYAQSFYLGVPRPVSEWQELGASVRPAAATARPPARLS
jgi:diguanylate cyclase (GGDEF)-like protein